jgi:hypothetical protein
MEGGVILRLPAYLHLEKDLKDTQMYTEGLGGYDKGPPPPELFLEKENLTHKRVYIRIPPLVVFYKYMDPYIKALVITYPAFSFSTHVYQSLKGMKTNGLTSVCVGGCVWVYVCVCVCVSV